MYKQIPGCHGGGWEKNFKPCREMGREEVNMASPILLGDSDATAESVRMVEETLGDTFGWITFNPPMSNVERFLRDGICSICLTPKFRQYAKI